ncbi:MAG TPA: ATP-binding protein, partial [Acidimicrobiales bacterium]|nr:ATP-binding protein [Acidimicrobiales bacterium]
MSADARTLHDQARGRTGSGQTPTAEPFVGRAHELGVVASLLAAAADGRGSLTVVSGEAGIGKSRFCDEVADRADRAGLAVVTARCWVDGGAPALWPWQPILRRLCGDAAADLLDADRGDRAVDPERFARFIAVTDRLAAACERAPVCLVIDDVHAADAGTLLLIRFVARTLTGAPLAVIVSRRRGEPVDGARAALLDDIEREATPVVLDRFDLDETGAFLATHGWPEIGPDLRTALHRVTGGNPLFLRRIAALGVVGSDAALPGGVEVAIRDAVARLDAGPRRVLQAAAVLGARPAVSEAAGVAEVEPAAVLDAVAHAEDAGLVSVRGPDRFAYGHELVRAAFEQGLAAGDRLDAHARAVRLVAPDSTALAPERSARRAHHALAAAARSAGDARLAVTACRAASRSMAASFAYEQADRLVSAAVEVHERPGLGAPPAQLLVEWAEAALLCGQLAEARGRFERAATAAQREGDAVLLGRAAVGLGGHWVNERRTPVEKARVLGLQRSALAGLPDVHEGLRCRLRARLAAEATYDGAPPEPVGAAVAAARTSGDPLALAESLSLWHHTLLAPEFARRRPGIADELVGVASEHGHGFLALMGLCWRAVDLFLLGDPRAAQALEVLRERADALVSLNIKYIVDVLDVMLLVRAGRLAEAEAAAQRCYDLGTEVGEVDALAYLSAHTLAIRWIQGRDAELLDLAADIAASPTLVQAEFAFRATAAAIAARAGHHDRARAAIEGLAPEGLAGLPRSSTWLVGMVAIVEVAAEVGDRVVADEVYALLAPFADLPVMPSLAVACLGSTERALGLAAQTAGRLERAVGHFERAVDANRRL